MGTLDLLDLVKYALLVLLLVALREAEAARNR